ncbi:MAG: hypothetical protein ACOY94_12505 [Bacillota bacterium]
MEELVPIINQVIDSLDRGLIQVSDTDEVRDTLLLLRSLALNRDDLPHSSLSWTEAAES